MTSKLLLDNIDTFVGIAKGKKWQVSPALNKWVDALHDTCPLVCLMSGALIRLAPEKKWVDFSHAPEKRPKGKCIVVFKGYSVPVIVQYKADYKAWSDGDYTAYYDSELFRDCEWHHEDGTVTPFGVEVEV